MSLVHYKQRDPDFGKAARKLLVLEPLRSDVDQLGRAGLGFLNPGLDLSIALGAVDEPASSPRSRMEAT